MNRLTDRSKEIPLPCAENAVFWARVHEKLARYEDTGLEPEEMRELLHDSAGPLHKKLGEWIDAEQEGRLLVLPCKVGGKVFRSSCPSGDCVTEIKINRRGYHFKCWWGWFHKKDVGKTVFLTHEDAEKALEGMKNDHRID